MPRPKTKMFLLMMRPWLLAVPATPTKGDC